MNAPAFHGLPFFVFPANLQNEYDGLASVQAEKLRLAAIGWGEL
jgi:hypothetical protein